jgi:hypothetical protein
VGTTAITTNHSHNHNFTTIQHNTAYGGQNVAAIVNDIIFGLFLHLNGVS